jgi:hypothetical protein
MLGGLLLGLVVFIVFGGFETDLGRGGKVYYKKE